MDSTEAWRRRAAWIWRPTENRRRRRQCPALPNDSPGRTVRILCCLNRDLASNLALNLLLPALRRHEVLVGLSDRVGNGSASRAEAPQRRELRSAEQLLPNEVFFPIIERAGLADSGSRHLTFAEMERHRGLQVASMPSPNTPAGLRAVASFAPDLILSIRYGAILKDPVIAIP